MLYGSACTFTSLVPSLIHPAQRSGHATAALEVFRSRLSVRRVLTNTNTAANRAYSGNESHMTRNCADVLSVSHARRAAFTSQTFRARLRRTVRTCRVLAWSCGPKTYTTKHWLAPVTFTEDFLLLPPWERCDIHTLQSWSAMSTHEVVALPDSHHARCSTFLLRRERFRRRRVLDYHDQG